MNTNLTPEQEAVMAKVREFWLDHLFGCKTTINQEVATEKINWMYSKANLKAPRVFYLRSPMECQVLVNVLKVYHSNFTKEFGNIKRSNKIGKTVKEELVIQHLETLSLEKEGTHSDENLFNQIFDHIMGNFSYESFASYGNISDYGWVSYYDFYNQIGEFENADFFEFRDLLKIGGVYDMIQLEDYCIVSAMPELIHKNEQNQLHCTTGVAVRFRDGFELAFINGRNIPTWVVKNPELITKEAFLGERNSDVRGAMYEVLGQEKMMNLLGAKEIARKTNVCKKPVNSDLRVDMQGNIVSGGVQYVDATEEYILYASEVEDPELGTLKWVGVQCPSTGTNYLLGVPPETEDPLDAVALTFGLEGKDYKLDQTS